MIGLYRGVTRTEVPPRGSISWMNHDEPPVVEDQQLHAELSKRHTTLHFGSGTPAVIFGHESEDVRSKIELRWSIIRDEYMYI